MSTQRRTFTIRQAEILCVGTEILLGDIVNTNAAFLSRRLAELGFNQFYQAAVGDNPDRLKQAVSAALARSDLLIMSGGLGPTYDDLTKETVARCMARSLVLNEEALRRMRERFAAMHRSMSPNNEKQAYLPENAIVFQNDAGTAPGCAIEDPVRGKIVVMLPGVPFELYQMFDHSVLPYLQTFSDLRFASRNVGIFGLGESEVEALLRPLMEASQNPTVAPYCGDGEVRLRVTARGKDSAVCEKLCAETINKIRCSPVAPYIYGVDLTLAEAVVSAFKDAGKTLSCAESCTGGLIAKRITDVPGASSVFAYGAVTYANEAKIRLLGVSPETLERYNAVSSQVAIEMAIGCRLLSSSDVAISATGLAGPDGGTPERPVGLVYIGIASHKGARAVELHLHGDRDRVRILASAHALSLALQELL